MFQCNKIRQASSFDFQPFSQLLHMYIVNVTSYNCTARLGQVLFCKIKPPSNKAVLCYYNYLFFCMNHAEREVSREQHTGPVCCSREQRSFSLTTLIHSLQGCRDIAHECFKFTSVGSLVLGWKKRLELGN